MVRRTHRPESPPTDTAIPGAVEFVLISQRGWVAATARSSWHTAAHGAKDHYLLMPLTSRIGAGICQVLDQPARAHSTAWLVHGCCRAGAGLCWGHWECMGGSSQGPKAGQGALGDTHI